MDESEIQQRIQLEGPKYNCIVERNNSGAFNDETGRPIRFGLGNVSKQHNDRMKSSDLIGGTVITITPDMVGRQMLVFTALEVKKPDWNPNKTLDKRETAQKNYIDWILARGGFAGFCNSIDSFLKIIRR